MYNMFIVCLMNGGIVSTKQFDTPIERFLQIHRKTEFKDYFHK